MLPSHPETCSRKLGQLQALLAPVVKCSSLVISTIVYLQLLDYAKRFEREKKKLFLSK
jgi:hypothetical protein